MKQVDLAAIDYCLPMMNDVEFLDREMPPVVAPDFLRASVSPWLQ